jgi:predicted alpha/beta superfamily hydrolase
MLRTIFVYLVMLFVLTGCKNECGKDEFKKSIDMIVTNAKTEVFHSKAIGDYKVTIYTPNEPAPKAGWPIIYLLDGDSYFLTAHDVLANQTCDRCIIQDGVVVAIDYFNGTRRDLDYLPKPEQFVLEVLPNNQINFPGRYGGADAFFDFLTQELKPEMERRFTINPHKQSLFGHSYGGLFTLYAFLTKPVVFDNYVISSPSMWFSGGYLFDLVDQYIANNRNQTLPQPTQLLISVGGAEQSLLPSELSLPDETQKNLLKHRQNRKMVEYSTRLFDKLKQANIHNLQLNYTIYPNQSHKTVAIVALQAGMQAAFNINSL